MNLKLIIMDINYSILPIIINVNTFYFINSPINHIHLSAYIVSKIKPRA